jgi:sugar/nucleoside kinase (ribokinase family)
VIELANLGRADAVLHFPDGAFACRAGTQEVFVQGSVQLPAADIIGATGAGDAFATGYLYGVHEGWSVARALLCGVCVAAQSLKDATPSAGVAILAECLKLGEIHGYRSLD